MRGTELDLPEGQGVTKLEWWFHRLGWLMFAAVMAAAVAGLLGPGPLSSQVVRAGSAFSVEYNRLVRRHSPEQLRVRLTPAMLTSGRVGLHIGQDFLDAITIVSIVPEPEGVAIAPGGQLYVFTVDAASPAGATIVFNYEHDRSLETIPVELSIESGAAARFTQFVYP